MNFAQFQKPQRYIGNEWNVVKKSHWGRIKICISYPDLYEIGMSNLGIRIIYGLLNKYPDTVCERVFMPGLDFIEFLREQRKKLFSLETKTALNKFDILGVHLGFELNFTNFLNILSLGGVPLKACERKKMIVLGGGIANPEPLADFIDVFFLGEFEETSDKFIEVLRKYKYKEERLKALSEIEGFYVPKFYAVTLKNNYYYFERKYSKALFPLKRVTVKNLETAFYPLKWLTPHTQIIHDRSQIEIARGCPNQCVFCQARASYHPYRQKPLKKIEEIIKHIYKNSGYENFSLLALSASDHSDIENIIDLIYSYFKEKHIGLSLPSLRIDDVIGRLYKKLIPLKKTSLTVAAEAANEPLRQKLNKKIDLNKLFEAANILRSLKIKRLKTYFMFGFPEENEEDLLSIGEFLDRLNKNSRLSINASVNIFIPKPFSIWQEAKMDSAEVLNLKRRVILRNVRHNTNIRVLTSFTEKSILEAVISRADRKFSAVIYRAFIKGAKFDAHAEHFCWDTWKQAMEEEGIDYRFYLDAKTDNYPWSFISTDTQCSILDT
ncbi:MAG: TIGR03960 family B12-binding radical SAM protein [Candidatus Omnitrophota bacterium]